MSEINYKLWGVRALEEMGCKHGDTAATLLGQFLTPLALEHLGDLDGLWYLRDEANWWFIVRPGREEDWLAVLKRRFEVVQILDDAMQDPQGFPLAFFLRISAQDSGGDTLLDLRTTPRVLLSALEPGGLYQLLLDLPTLKDAAAGEWVHHSTGFR